MSADTIGTDCEMSDDEARALIEAQFRIIDLQREKLRNAIKGEESQFLPWLYIACVLIVAAALIVVLVFPGQFKFFSAWPQATLLHQMLPAASVFVAFLTVQAFSELLDTIVRKRRDEVALHDIEKLRDVAENLVKEARYRG